MESEPSPWPDLEAEDPEQFERVLFLFKEFTDLTSTLQGEMAHALMAKEEFRNFFNKKQLNLPEEVVMNKIEAMAKAFVGMMPMAEAHGVNLMASVFGIHPSITGDPLIARLIERIHEEIQPEVD